MFREKRQFQEVKLNKSGYQVYVNQFKLNSTNAQNHLSTPYNLEAYFEPYKQI